MKKKWLIVLGLAVLAACEPTTATDESIREGTAGRSPGNTPMEVGMEEHQEPRPAAGATSETSQRTPERQVTEPLVVDLRKLTPQAAGTREPAEAPAPGVPDPLLKLVQQVKQDLGKQLELDIGEIELVQAEAVTWRDSGLGCPQPGMRYLQVLTPGYRIELRAQGKAYFYHSRDTSYFVRCDQPDQNGQLKE